MSYTNSHTDTALLEGCHRQDRQAQYLLYRRFFGLVMSICLRYASGKQEALEITNSVFLKVMAQAGAYEPSGSVGAWIGKIALYTSIDAVRKKMLHQRHYVAMEHMPDAPVVNEGIARLSEEALLALIQQLPVIQRTVFCLFVIEGYSHEEIAAQLQIPVGTSKWQLSQARAQLKKQLTETVSAPKPAAVSPDIAKPDISTTFIYKGLQPTGI